MARAFARSFFVVFFAAELAGLVAIAMRVALFFAFAEFRAGTAGAAGFGEFVAGHFAIVVAIKFADFGGGIGEFIGVEDVVLVFVEAGDARTEWTFTAICMFTTFRALSAITTIAFGARAAAFAVGSLFVGGEGGGGNAEREERGHHDIEFFHNFVLFNFAFEERFGGLSEFRRCPNFHALSMPEATLSLREAERIFEIILERLRSPIFR